MGFGMLAIVLFINIYTLNLTISDLRIATELGRNDTHRLYTILDIEDKLGTAARTDYAWHFNEGHKLDLLIKDIDLIKNELGLGQNLTYAGPNSTNSYP